MRCSSIPLILLSLIAAPAAGCHFDSTGSGGFFDGDGDAPWDDDPSGDPSSPTDGGDGERFCFFGADDPDTPAAVIEHTIEVVEGIDTVHVELTLDPRFVDNTYGASSIGWENSKKGTHAFGELVGSDRAELLLFAGDGTLTVDFELDYLTADDTAPSGYRSLGVTGGDGDVLVGDASWIVDATSSLDRNLNERGYGSFTTDSPATDSGYSPNPAAPAWDYRVVYEAWVSLDAFGPTGYGEPSIDHIHASPSKATDNTIVVDPRPCPPDWCTDPYGCEPDCNDPDGCDGDPGTTGDPECTQDVDCPTGEFCGEQGTCLPIIG